jgi:hypothetical protein
MKLTNQEVVDKGNCIAHWACDWDPVNEECDSNGSRESVWELEGKYYHIFLTFDADDKPCLPNDKAERCRKSIADAHRGINV